MFSDFLYLSYTNRQTNKPYIDKLKLMNSYSMKCDIYDFEFQWKIKNDKLKEFGTRKCVFHFA